MVLFQRSRTPAAVLAVTSLAVAALAGFGTSAAGAAPTAAPPPRPSQAQSKVYAADAASSLVANRPAGLHAGKDDKFTAKSVISEPSGLQYVPYERTYKGLPVVGGDFVVVTDARGRCKSTSVAQTTAVPEPVDDRQGHRGGRQGDRDQAAEAASTRRPRRRWPCTPSTARRSWRGSPGHRQQRQGAVEPVGVRRRAERQGARHPGARHGTATARRPTAARTRCTWTPRCRGSTYSMKDPTTTNLSCQDAANNTTFTGPDDIWGNGDGHQPGDRLRRRAVRRAERDGTC